jgi:hypothetical protein
MSDNPGHGNRRPKVRFDPGVQAHIGRQLKAMFDEVVHEPMPDNLLRLLDSLQTPEKNDDDAPAEETASPSALRAPEKP